MINLLIQTKNTFLNIEKLRYKCLEKYQSMHQALLQPLGVESSLRSKLGKKVFFSVKILQK